MAIGQESGGFELTVARLYEPRLRGSQTRASVRYSRSCGQRRFEIISPRFWEGETHMQYVRTGGRIPVELPVEIRWKSPRGKPRQAQGKTVSISSNGVLLSVAADLRPQTAVTIRVNLPLEFTKVPLVLYCHGRVMRLGPVAMTVSAVIDDYKLRPAPKGKGKTSRKKK